MEGRFYKIGLILLIVILLGVALWYFFKDKTLPNPFSNQSGYQGSTINYNEGNVINVNNNTTSNNNTTTINPASNITIKENTTNNKNVTGSVNYGAGSIILTEELQTNLLTQKAGSVLAFASASPQQYEASLSLDIPGYSSGSSNRMNGAKPSSSKVCLAIMGEIGKERVQILQMTKEAQEIHILNKLRYIPNFGGASFEKQKEIIDAILTDLSQNKAINAALYCAMIEGINPNLVYQQCLIVVENIIANNITNASKIQEIMDKDIPGFYFLPQTSKDSIVQSVIKGMQEGNLSKEKICSFIQSIILNNYDKMAIYKQCVAVIEKLSESSRPLNKNQILTALFTISGFSSLNKAQQNEVVEDILNDKGQDLDAEKHCSKIVSYILEAIKASDVYKQCIKVLEGIANGNRMSVLGQLSTIPGFNILTTEQQEKILNAVNEAIKNNTIKDEATRIELCVNITALILDAMNKNELYNKCVTIVTGLVNNSIQDDDKILKELKEITGFSLLSKEEKQKMIDAIKKIDKNAPNVTSLISNACINLITAITDAIETNVITKQCITIMNGLIEDKKLGTMEIDEAEILKRLQNGIIGFTNLTETLQKEFASKTFNALNVTDPSDKTDPASLESMKREICYSVTIAILEGGSNFTKRCIEMIEGLFNKQKDNKNDVKILETLKKLLSSVTLNNESLVKKYIDAIKKIEEPNIKIKISAVCFAMEGDDGKNQALIDCAKGVINIVKSGNITMEELKAINRFRSFPNAFIQNTIIPEVKALNPNSIDTQAVIRICSLSPAEDLGDGSNNGGNGNGGDLPQLTNQQNNMNGIGPKDRGKCLVLNSDIFKKYEEYELAIKNNPNSNISNITYITDINNNIPDGEYYIPDRYLNNIEDEMNNDFEKCLADLPGNKCENSSALVQNAVYQKFTKQPNIYTLQESDSYKKTFTFASDLICTKAVTDVKAIEDFIRTNDCTSDLTQNATSALTDEEINKLVKELRTLQVGSCTKTKISEVSTNVSAKLARCSTKYSSLQAVLNTPARKTFIARLFRDRDFVRKAQVAQNPQLDTVEYVIELGKCTRQDKDLDHWQKVSRIMQNLVSGEREVPFGLMQNKTDFPKYIRNSVFYKSTKETIEKALKEKDEINKVYTFRTINGFNNLDERKKEDHIKRFIAIVNSNTQGSQGLQNQDKAIEELSYLMANDFIISPNQKTQTLAEIADCSKVIPLSSNSNQMEFIQLDSNSLQVISQRIVAENGISLLAAFDASGKEQRKEIIKRLWERTADEYETAIKNSTKPAPLKSQVCEQVMNDVWGNYSEDNIKDAIGGAFAELMSSFENIAKELESGESVKNYTSPPSEKCRCYAEKMFQELNNKTISNYKICNGANDASSYLAKIRATTNLYITAKEAQLASTSGGNTGGVSSKSVCVLMFKGIADIASDQGEVSKFLATTSGSTDLDPRNETTRNQMCVQQLRDIYSSLKVFKETYFTQGEKYDTTKCNSLSDIDR